MIIEKMVKDKIEISDYDNKRCSRDCPYCYKRNGLYKCFRTDVDGDDIELLDDVDVEGIPSAHTYGFKRTNSCLKVFGNHGK